MILNGERSIYYSVGREIKNNELGACMVWDTDGEGMTKVGNSL